jgi:uncharacterized phage protein (TIGR01671 family)
MREIKFRCWNINLAVPGSNEFMEYSDKIGIRKFFDSYPKAGVVLNGGAERVIMQFSGLRDKYNVAIYEGDLMALYDEEGNHKFTYKVVFEDAKFVLYHIKSDYGKWGDLSRAFDPDFTKYDFHVIGNIYQNPELLK